jgi:hypothetical protein
MSKLPRWYRKQLLENRLEKVLKNPLADQANVNAARKAVELKLDQQDFAYQQSQRHLTNKYLEQL